MNRNQKEAMIAGIELAERAHVMEMTQARTLLKEALDEITSAREDQMGTTHNREPWEIEVRIKEFLK